MPRPDISRPLDRLQPFGFNIWLSTGAAMTGSHTHADVEVNYLFSGHIDYFLGGRFERVEPRRLTVFWGGIPHRSLEKSATVRGIWLTFPLGWLLRYSFAQQLRDDLLAGAMVSETDIDSYPGSVDDERLSLWLRDFQRHDPQRMDIIFSELGDRLNRLSLSREKPCVSPRLATGDDPTRRLERLTSHIGDTFQHEIDATQLARVAGLHPKYLHTYFKKHCGISLWEYVLRLRLAHAQRLLATTRMSVLDAALESGFGSQAAFYHAFKKHFPGRKPTDIRRSSVHPSEFAAKR